MKLALVLPTYGKFVYARRTAQSFFLNSPEDSICVLVDDASPMWYEQNWEAWQDGLPEDRLFIRSFPENAGLTRSWNWGLAKARELGAEVTIAGNSDLIFTPNWFSALDYNLKGRYSLLGPVTNAPGMTNRQRQAVRYFFPRYRVTDDPGYLANVAKHLRITQPQDKVVTSLINGFCMAARTDTWWQGAFDADHVFDPSKRMTGNEDELQQRWLARGWLIGFVPASFVFHYRAVSRGDKYRHQGWFRLSPGSKPVS